MATGITTADLLRAGLNSLPLVMTDFEQLGDNVFYYRGKRPSGHWHAHGCLENHPTGFRDSKLMRFIVLKQRWCRPDRTETCHSRPPDDLGRHFDALAIALTVFAVLDAAVGFHRVELPFATEGMKGPSVRTMQRWVDRALPDALSIHQALRDAALERCEPRPERCFPRGLPPPRDGKNTRRWRNPFGVWQLLSGLSIAFNTATTLNIPTATLLAEARGRWTHT